MLDPHEMICQPFYCIEIEPTLAEPHPTLVSEELWIKSNVRMIEEVGPERYLRMLLNALRVRASMESFEEAVSTP